MPRVAISEPWYEPPAGRNQVCLRRPHGRPPPLKAPDTMDQDRITGVGKQIVGALKQAAGKLVGDAKLQVDGKAEQAAGKLQNAVGGVKDTLKR
jgi:uncharacterized protein YjbJ (UPF0337 family)